MNNLSVIVGCLHPMLSYLLEAGAFNRHSCNVVSGCLPLILLLIVLFFRFLISSVTRHFMYVRQCFWCLRCMHAQRKTQCTFEIFWFTCSRIFRMTFHFQKSEFPLFLGNIYSEQNRKGQSYIFFPLLYVSFSSFSDFYDFLYYSDEGL